MATSYIKSYAMKHATNGLRDNPAVTDREYKGVFSVLKLPNLKLYVRGDSIQDDGTGFCDAWLDKSGNGNHILQATSAFRPAVIENSFNGRKGLRFDATNDFMQVDFGEDFAQPSTYFIVHNNTKTGTAISGIFDGVDANKRNTFNHIGTIGTLRITAQESSSITLLCEYAKAQPFAHQVSTLVFNTTSSAIYENGVAKAAATIQTDPINKLQIGRRTFISTQYFSGDINCIIMCNALLTTQQRQETERFLLRYYNLP